MDLARILMKARSAANREYCLTRISRTRALSDAESDKLEQAVREYDSASRRAGLVR